MKHYKCENTAVRLAGTTATREFLEPIFTDRNRELLVVALCDEEVRLMQLLTFPGEAGYVSVSLADIMRRTACSDCVGFIVAHNHPSRDTSPSRADIAFTQRLAIAAEAMDMTFLDHIIFNGGPALSFREQGHL